MITKSSKEVIIYHVILHWPVDIDRLKKLKWRPINPVSIEIWNSIQLLHIIEYIQQYFSYVVAFSYIGGGSRNDHGYVPPVVNTSWSFSHTWFITGFVTRLTRRVLLVEQQLLTHPEHLSSSPVYNGVRVTWSLVLCVCFVDRCLSFFFLPLCCLFFFDIRILITPLVSSNSSNACRKTVQCSQSTIVFVNHRCPLSVIYRYIHASGEV
jgi:hypothetical protein